MKARITRLHFLRALYARFFREHRGYVLTQTSGAMSAEPERRHFLDIGTLADEPYGTETDVLFGVCPRRTVRGHDEDVGFVVALWADLDVGLVGHEAKTSVFSHVQDLARAVRSFPVKPSIVVESGKGAHLYWLLNKAHDAEQAERIEEIQRSIASRLGCDMDTTLGALLRLPKTVNNKVPGRPTYCDVRYINFDARYPLEAFENLERRVARTPMKTHADNRRDFPELLEIDLTRIPALSGFDFGDESCFRSDSSADTFDDRNAATARESGAEILLEVSSQTSYEDHDPTSVIDPEMLELPGQLAESSVDGSPTIELTQEAINEVLEHVQSAVLGSTESDEEAAVELFVDAPAEEQSPRITDLPDPSVEDEIDLTGYRTESYTGFDLESYEEIPVSAPIEMESESEILLTSADDEYLPPSEAHSGLPDLGRPSSGASDDLTVPVTADGLKSGVEEPDTGLAFQEHNLHQNVQDTFVGGEDKGFIEVPLIEPIPLARISGYAEQDDDITLDETIDPEPGPHLGDEYFSSPEAPSAIDRTGGDDHAEIDLTVCGEESSDGIQLPHSEDVFAIMRGIARQTSSDSEPLMTEPEEKHAPATELPSSLQSLGRLSEPHLPVSFEPALDYPKYSRGLHNLGLRRIVRSHRTHPFRLQKSPPRPSRRRKYGRKRRHHLRGRYYLP